eukprot:CAMPEP_0202689090 /NCGR_PEP_ID=MMETSP1385-20130828/4436_1 /ASSEMBLY_ACC=CAM_ASM_000861 /TAXON_ID=933848 /ORGANISM="Elphidium margaritaceum" /LENGTH=131 /DNA_ID=CAMNT_0049344177 /DNA_START=15 /DNA_END=410 /DNA_ORIENTATION=-
MAQPAKTKAKQQIDEYNKKKRLESQPPKKQGYDQDSDGRAWSFEYDFIENGKKGIIVLKLSDAASNQNWEARFDEATYVDPSKEYDAMHKVFNDKNVAFKCGFDKESGGTWIEFRQDAILRYVFRLKPTSK